MKHKRDNLTFDNFFFMMRMMKSLHSLANRSAARVAELEAELSGLAHIEKDQKRMGTTNPHNLIVISATVENRRILRAYAKLAMGERIANVVWLVRYVSGDVSAIQSRRTPNFNDKSASIIHSTQGGSCTISGSKFHSQKDFLLAVLGNNYFNVFGTEKD